MNSTELKFTLHKHDFGFGNVLVLRQEWSEKVPIFLQRGDIQGIRLSELVGWKGADIEFLGEVSTNSVSSIEVVSDRIKDVSVLSKFAAIRMIGLATKDAKGFRSSDYPQLETLMYSCTKNGELDLFPDSLKVLFLDRYTSSTLQDLPAAENLTWMQLGARKLLHLGDICKFNKLRKLTLLDVNQLKSIADIAVLKDLETLEIFGGKNIETFRDVGKLSNLKTLELINCSNIASLEPFMKIKSLERLVIDGNTTVDDGDLSYLDQIPNLNRLIMVPRRHYRPKTSMVLKRINGS